MKFKNLVKLSAPVLALLLATACSNGQEDVVPQDEPVNQNLDVPVIKEENSNDLEEDSNLEESESETTENNNQEEESLTEDTEEDLLEEESNSTELEEDPLNSENHEDESIE